ncbi:MAG: nitroreductase family deazaflavin-dependent oxidoreductase [Halioglobus sp.]
MRLSAFIYLVPEVRRFAVLRKVGEPAPPKGLKLKLFRSPLYVYRLGLGFLLGERFIHLKHWGRKSGKPRETVIEVIEWDKEHSKMFSASGFGEKSQWFQNISANSSVFVTVGNIQYQATARVVSSDEAKNVLLRYAKAHPKSIKAVARLSGYDMEGSEQDILEFSQIIKVVEFSLSDRAG